MSRRKWLIAAFVLVLVSIVPVWQFLHAENGNGAQRETRPSEGVLIGNALPGVQLTNLEGKAVKIGSPGKVTVINFWATWCPHCRAELPELENFARKYGSEVNFYAVNIQESRDVVAGYLKQNSLNMPVVLDLQGEIARMFRISAIPTTIVADKQGVIQFRKSGTVTSSELEGVIKGF